MSPLENSAPPVHTWLLDEATLVVQFARLPSFLSPERLHHELMEDPVLQFMVPHGARKWIEEDGWLYHVKHDFALEEFFIDPPKLGSHCFHPKNGFPVYKNIINMAVAAAAALANTLHQQLHGAMEPLVEGIPIPNFSHSFEEDTKGAAQTSHRDESGDSRAFTTMSIAFDRVVNDIDFSDLEAKYSLELDESFDNVIVVDGLPKVDENKYEKLLTVVKKIFKKYGTIKPEGLSMPQTMGSDEKLMTAG
ncbi:Translation initiation factor 3 subunit b [Massospora cicadina]|nr:Translation initiation factor 3 subunit b [Massospora cicadina]